RTRTTTAPQALLLLNGDFTLERAERWSGALLAKHHDAKAVVQEAIKTAWGREATEDEIKASITFIDNQTTIDSASGDEANLIALPSPCPSEMDLCRAAAIVDFC